MSTKKLLAVLLTLALCIGTLAACQSTPAETTAPAAQSTTAPAAQSTTVPAAEETTAPAEALKNVDIYPISSDHTFTIATGNTNAEKADNWNLMVDTIGLNVEWQIVSADQMPLLFVGGAEMPDMFFQANALTAAQINEYGQAGLLVNYADYIDLMPNMQAMLAERPTLLDAVLQEDGSFYMLPGWSNTLTGSSNLFYIRTDMTKEAGWEELPTTTEEFLTMCEDLQNYYADVEGYVPMVCNGAGSIAFNGAYANFFFPAFGELLRTDITTNADRTKIEVGFVTEQFKNYITFMHTLYAEGYMDPDCFTNESAVGKAKMIEKTTTMNPFATYLTKDNFASGELEFQVCPVLTSQYYGEKHWAEANHTVARQYMISSTCPDIEAAVQFMDAFYATRENPLNEEGTIWGITLWIGEMGVDYEVNEEEGWFVYKEHEGFDTPSLWLNVAGTGSAVVTDWGYYENGGTGQMVKALGTRDILMPHGVNILYTTLLMLTQNEQDIYNDCWTDIQNKVVEMNAAFITGQADIEAEWDNYINDLYSMGLQDVIDVYQAALDRYNAR